MNKGRTDDLPRVGGNKENTSDRRSRVKINSLPVILCFIDTIAQIVIHKASSSVLTVADLQDLVFLRFRLVNKLNIVNTISGDCQSSWNVRQKEWIESLIYMNRNEVSY